MNQTVERENAMKYILDAKYPNGNIAAPTKYFEQRHMQKHCTYSILFRITFIRGAFKSSEFI